MRQLTEAAKVAAQIRKHLKANGVTAKVSSSNYSGGNSVRVLLFNPLPATRQQVEAYTSQFEYGKFDGMTDSYDYSNIRDDIPQVRFLFVNAEYSDDMHQDCWEWIITYYNLQNAPASFREASNYRCELGMFTYGNMLISNELATGSRGFWFTKKKRLAA